MVKLSSLKKPQPWRSLPSEGIRGELVLPGDKSISHRSLMLGLLNEGVTVIKGLLESEDVLSTLDVCQQLGAKIVRKKDFFQVHGVGVGGCREPVDVLNCGNSGTSVRLLSGILSVHGFSSFLTGDASLRSRPMSRVMDPLNSFGAHFTSRLGGYLPLSIRGRDCGVGIDYEVPVASAQIKSCVLLAGLHCHGRTCVHEKIHTRDHTERLLRHMGCPVHELEDERGHHISIVGPVCLKGDHEIDVGSDPSSAAFLVGAAVLTPNSHVVIKGVCLNELRMGFYDQLKRMGARIDVVEVSQLSGEPFGDIHAHYTPNLQAIEIGEDESSRLIDEYPILSVVASFASGRSVFRGLGELRVKESDRLLAIAQGLSVNGVSCGVQGDDLWIDGSADCLGGGCVPCHQDHRIAMSFLVMGLASSRGVEVDDVRPIETSFPGFIDILQDLGCFLERS